MSDHRQASLTKTGNAQRAEWRQKCRQTLAAHINSNLGIAVEPAQVRLLPELQDSYSWSVLPERKHLFTKQLSKHSVGAYMELCREVGKSFEAVVPTSVTKESSDEESIPSLPMSSDTTFSSKIRCLQNENADLTVELAKIQDAAQEESEARQTLEEKLKISEAGLWAAHSEMEKLQSDKSILSAEAESLSWRLSEMEKGRTMALSALQRCSNSPDTCSQ